MPDPLRVASDVGRRLAELRELLGETQRDFAARFGRGWKQVSMWERGHQRPRPSVLVLAAQKNGWPLGIFEEGGPRPAEIGVKALKSPVETRTGDRTAPRSPSPGRRKEDIELRAVVLASDPERAVRRSVLALQEQATLARLRVLELHKAGEITPELAEAWLAEIQRFLSAGGAHENL
jgi:transcriptional regulator with XRE-family HTH domain